MGSPQERTLFGGKSPQRMPWHPLPHMEEWLEVLAAEGVSSGYIRPAKVGLAHFAQFAAGANIQHPDEITRHHLLKFQTYLTSVKKQNGDPLALSYRKQLMRYLRNWINWLEEAEYIEKSPWVRIKISRTRLDPKPLEAVEVAELFAVHRQQAFRISPFSFHRREAMLVLLFAWGLRLHELQALTLAALDMRLDHVTVGSKARAASLNSRRALPYGDELKLVLKRWFKVRATKAMVGEDALFIDRYGKPLSDHAIRQIITDLGQSAGIQINPHRLRDTFGATMLDHDVQVEQIMQMMGHTERSQTLAYARVGDPRLMESHERVITPIIRKFQGNSRHDAVSDLEEGQ